ncbi:hypothetical protein ScPMuIL_006436 [Solemya velum]
MKVKRQKHVRKVIIFYRNNFGLQPPYKILIDGTFCKAALHFKLNISEQLPKYLDSEVVFYTTNCVLAECESFGTLLYGPLKVLRQFKVHPCKHKSPVLAYKCLLSLLKASSDKKFFLATQDQALTEKARDIPGVPLLFIAYNAITLEPPSELSRQVADTSVTSRTAPTEHAHSVLKQMKKEAFGEPEEVVKKKRKKKSGPNPLSCKKKKKKTGVSKETKSKRKRKKIKMSKHIKEHFQNLMNKNT